MAERKRMSHAQRWLALRALLKVADEKAKGRETKGHSWEEVECDVVLLLNSNGRTAEDAFDRRQTVRALFESLQRADHGAFSESIADFADQLRIPPDARVQPDA